MNSDSVKTTLRYLGSNATAALTVCVVFGAMTPEQSQSILANFHTMYVATHDFVGAFANIWYIIFPILSGVLLKMGLNAGGVGAMMDRVFKAAKEGDVDAKVAIVSAAASPEIGTKAVINPTLAANPATPGNVVASTREVQ